MSTMCAIISQNDVKPMSRWRRARVSWPYARSIHGIRAISSTWISIRSAATSPASRAAVIATPPAPDAFCNPRLDSQRTTTATTLSMASEPATSAHHRRGPRGGAMRVEPRTSGNVLVGRAAVNGPLLNSAAHCAYLGTTFTSARKVTETSGKFWERPCDDAVLSETPPAGAGFRTALSLVKEHAPSARGREHSAEELRAGQ